MKKIIGILAIAIVAFSSCKKDSASTESFTQLEKDVINDFVNKTALPQYDSLASAGAALNTAVINLKANTTDANLATARLAWKHVRTVWEQCEGFLIGPVEEQDYDPNTDTWPTAFGQMDSLLTSSNPLEVADIQNLDLFLRGYHPVEYLLFRASGNVPRTSAMSFTPRELKYLSSLTADIADNNLTPLLQSWTSAPSNYAQQILTVGDASNPAYKTRLAFFIDIAGEHGMGGICGEVSNHEVDGKMWGPYSGNNNQGDSTITESPYSDNSLNDFRYNIIGAQNVYLGLNGGKGIKDLVAANNKNLDYQIQTKFTTAINSFNNITQRYELAILASGGQRLQVKQTIDAIQDLESILSNDLVNYLNQYVKD